MHTYMYIYMYIYIYVCIYIYIYIYIYALTYEYASTIFQVWIQIRRVPSLPPPPPSWGGGNNIFDLLIYVSVSLPPCRLKCPMIRSMTLSDGEYYEMVKSNFERADRATIVRTVTNYSTSIVSLLTNFKDLLFN